MSSKRYTEEFKIEAVKQVTERGYSTSEVAKRRASTPIVFITGSKNTELAHSMPLRSMTNKQNSDAFVLS